HRTPLHARPARRVAAGVHGRPGERGDPRPPHPGGVHRSPPAPAPCRTGGGGEGRVRRRAPQPVGSRTPRGAPAVEGRGGRGVGGRPDPHTAAVRLGHLAPRRRPPDADRLALRPRPVGGGAAGAGGVTPNGPPQSFARYSISVFGRATRSS